MKTKIITVQQDKKSVQHIYCMNMRLITISADVADRDENSETVLTFSSIYINQHEYY